MGGSEERANSSETSQHFIKDEGDLPSLTDFAHSGEVFFGRNYYASAPEDRFHYQTCYIPVGLSENLNCFCTLQGTIRVSLPIVATETVSRRNPGQAVKQARRRQVRFVYIPG